MALEWYVLVYVGKYLGYNTEGICELIKSTNELSTEINLGTFYGLLLAKMCFE